MNIAYELHIGQHRQIASKLKPALTRVRLVVLASRPHLHRVGSKTPRNSIEHQPAPDVGRANWNAFYELPCPNVQETFGHILSSYPRCRARRSRWLAPI